MYAGFRFFSCDTTSEIRFPRVFVDISQQYLEMLFYHFVNLRTSDVFMPNCDDVKGHYKVATGWQLCIV